MIKNKFNFNETSTKVFKKQVEIKEIINQTLKEKDIKTRFDKTVKEIEENFTLIELAKEENKNIYENLLRGQIVFLFGAVDLYMHDITLESYMKIIYEKKKSNDKLDKISITLKSLIDFFGEENEEKKREILENSLRQFSNYKTYLTSKNIKQLLETISDNKLYVKVYEKLGITKFLFNERLNNYYKRRNKIAHQMDFDKESNVQTSIDEDYVFKMIEFYKEFIENLHKFIVNDI